MERVLATITPCVTMNMNEILLRPFNRLELEQALGHMYPTEAPGIDGMPALFYQCYWHIVGDSVSDACRILNGEGSVQDFNHTLIALIPKITQPTRVTDFRPISLCTVLYKMVAKSFANRLKMILLKSGMVFCGSNDATFRFCGKLDNSYYGLYYYSLFLDAMARKSSWTYSEQLECIKGVKVAAKAPPVSHLFFADDSLIFLEAKIEVFEEVKGIFATYEKASGQKTNLSFSSNVTAEIIDAARNILQVPVVACHERYLGLPTVVGRNRRSLFLTVQEWVKWKDIGIVSLLMLVSGNMK
ncbi:unnamed protein product [Prunus brigantina]